ncbi:MULTISPECIES: serine/threonine-protein kinase [unclassified Frankia]|uniref:serine/threonine-protein kinase n=1 Tax=unclassified Frankia TaxID=2632575 RepID=UPI002AD52BD9|nr:MULTISPECIES: serine/threonine-protein kinase [unclassified Frankia]
MPVDRARVATALPGYDVGAVLGQGSFGQVRAGRHRELNRAVAIKIQTAGLNGATIDYAAESRQLAAMDHPHVVRVHDYVKTDDLHLIIMELLGGGTLARRTNLTPEGACAVGLAVATALSYAHGRDVLHRDIKPGNILFDTDGLVKITDFGIAKIINGPAADASRVVGTAVYMAPEQFTAGRLYRATDVYALGIVLYQLLTGAPPFDPQLSSYVLGQHHCNTIPDPPTGVPTLIAEVIMRALEKDPADRQPTAHAFALDLAHAAADIFGLGWTARSGIGLRLDDDVRAAADQFSAPTVPAQPSDPPKPPPKTPHHTTPHTETLWAGCGATAS